MLLSSDLSSLGSALRNERGESLSTKGIASVRAQVVNLQEAFPERKEWLVHDTFCRAVVQEFMQTYGGKWWEAEYVGQEMLEREAKLKSGYEEITSWEWTYGSTPEFTHKLTTRRQPGSSPTQQMTRFGESKQGQTAANQKGPLFSTPRSSNTFSWGDFDLEINSRQGIIQSCHLTSVALSSRSDGEAEATLKALVSSMEGQRYDDYASRPPGTLHGANDADVKMREHRGQDAKGRGEASIQKELLAWLKTAL
jgi:hypothetical protein